MDYRHAPFEIDPRAYEDFKPFAERGLIHTTEFKRKLENLQTKEPGLAAEFSQVMRGDQRLPTLFGGSADLSGSTKIKVPNLTTFRPANVQECIAAFMNAVHSIKSPTAIITSRLAFTYASSSVEQALKGAYVILPAEQPIATILATGSEVGLALDAAVLLEEQHKKQLRIISMPSYELFMRQPHAYQQEVLGKGLLITLEAGSTAP
ncbi:unnamed protein product [Didymodactylos carnosus]|uniref:Transketolase-like C-terminal domain-containing protein n=1 Tax=Didymodactylos carnosus TaxID=1234261 RepID=A0A8S2GZ80_9BILA|nr:unnamed protein product [Didymodactylos carnosus]CAF3579970.1 unnamed protein product [Didymodactylos carnosus]